MTRKDLKTLIPSNKQKKVIDFFRLLILIAILSNLIIFLKKNILAPVTSNQILITGNSYLIKKQIIESLEIKFPQPLLSINPKLLESRLAKKLPIQSVLITRNMFPLSLEIAILERKPIAFANKKSGTIAEEGLIDKDGNWIKTFDYLRAGFEIEDIRISGWVPSKKPLIAVLLLNKENLGSPLRNIYIDETGSMSLQTEKINLVQFGTNPKKLEKQIQALSYISRIIPKSCLLKYKPTLDLRNPERPQFKLLNQEAHSEFLTCIN